MICKPSEAHDGVVCAEQQASAAQSDQDLEEVCRPRMIDWWRECALGAEIFFRTRVEHGCHHLQPLLYLGQAEMPLLIALFFESAVW